MSTSQKMDKKRKHEESEDIAPRFKEKETKKRVT